MLKFGGGSWVKLPANSLNTNLINFNVATYSIPKRSFARRPKHTPSDNLYQSSPSNFLFKTKNGDCPAYYSNLQQHKKSGIIVLQEWWGMNKQITDVAESIARKGHRALVPDLYRGKVALDHEDAGHLMNGLDFGRAVEDIRGAAQYFKQNGCIKVAVIGFCMGGALSLLAAANVKELSGAICFHGSPPLSNLNASNIKIPVQCHFGDKDDMKGFSDPEAANNLEKHLLDAGVSLEFHRYPNSGHAFTNAARPEKYNPDDAALAWKRVYDWLNRFITVHV
jgi:carboxymethylenebutenolidase